MPSRKEFLQSYDFPLHPAQDFASNGRSAVYAADHPREWGAEEDGFDFLSGRFSGSTERENLAFCGFSAAVSPDGKLLAISLGLTIECILIYDIRSKELRQTLDGGGTPIFRPHVQRLDHGVSSIEHESAPNTTEVMPSYTLISSIPSAEPRTRTDDRLILWELDRNGRLLTEEEPIDSSAFATKAIEAIIPMLNSEHEWCREFVRESNLHAEFAKALTKASADHRRRHNTIFQDAQLPAFLTAPFNSNGSTLLYIVNNRTTQRGMRDPDDLPQVILYDIDSAQDVHRLRGHTDYITWADFSPDGCHVASVSWDSTLRMYSSHTGELEWASPDSGGQSWAGAFSSDSKYIAWCSHGGREIKVHDVSNGEVRSTFPEKISRWCQCIAWHPRDHQILLCEGKNVCIWRPLDGHDGIVTQRWVLEDGEGAHRMSSVMNAFWMDDGRTLCLVTSEGTTIVYDMLTNVKEMFKRPSGADVAYVKSNFYKLRKEANGTRVYLSVDGDGKVRYWNRSTAQPGHTVDLSQGEGHKGESGQLPEPGTNDSFETGSPKVVEREQEEKGSASSDTEREGWAEKGADIWTAQ